MAAWTAIHLFFKGHLSLVALIAALTIAGGATYVVGPGGGDAGSPSSTATAAATVEFDDDHLEGPGDDVEHRRSGGVNKVTVENRTDGRFRARGEVDYTAVKGDRVAPQNLAYVAAECTDCQTVGIALQVAFYKRGASVVVPKNEAVAINYRCTRCVTIAIAIQYAIPVDDPRRVPDNVKRLVRELDREFKDIERIRSLQDADPVQVEADINSILNRFQELGAYLQKSRDEERGDNGTATPTAMVSPAASATATPAATPTSTATPVGTATAAP